MGTLHIGQLVALALFGADANVQPVGAPAQAQIQGESDTFYVVEPGGELELDVTGPGKVVLDLRGWAAFLQPVVAPKLAVTLDDKPAGEPHISKPANREVVEPHGFASTSTLLEVMLDSGTHKLVVKAEKGAAEGLVAATFFAPELDAVLLPSSHPKPPEPAAAVPVVKAEAAPSTTNARPAFALEAMAGVSMDVQIGGSSPLLGLGADVQVGADRALGVGLSVDYLRYPLLMDAALPPPQGEVALSGSLTAIPILARASYRFLDGSVQPFVGIGAGITLATLQMDGSGHAQNLLPTFEARAGLGMAAGPGELLVQARLLASQGDFSGVGSHFAAGGAGLQAGYRFEL
ncbi:MAG: hypothetical protein JST54_22120 [Deltaproteobacteria bacterium]|nr:hypothetical protein [Deltaproteobacteria bacterium]